MTYLDDSAVLLQLMKCI